MSEGSETETETETETEVCVLGAVVARAVHDADAAATMVSRRRPAAPPADQSALADQAG